MPRLPVLPPGVHTLTTVDSDRLRRMHSGSLPATPEQCITCEGKREFPWWNVERTEVVTWECACRDQWLLHRFFLNSGVGLAYQRLWWTDIDGIEEGALVKVLDYLDRSEAYIRAGCGLVLHGGMGTGKTMLAALLLKRMLADGHDGYFTTFSAMLSTLMSGYDDPDERLWYHRRIKNATVLVIDDIGKEHRQRRAAKGEGLVDLTTSTARSAADEVIRHRVSSSLPTIVTTNLNMDKISQNYGSNVLSLLQERSTDYEFTGDNYRQKQQMRLEREVDLGLVRPIVVG